MKEIAAERLSGLTDEGYFNNYMQTGQDLESEARECYEKINHCFVQQVGFISLNDWVGASGDGLMLPDGGLEIKCVKRTTHITTILADKAPTTYIPQMQGLMYVADLKWVDFVSYAPGLNRPYFCKRVLRDDAFIANFKTESDKFIEELKNMIDKLNNPF